MNNKKHAFFPIIIGLICIFVQVIAYCVLEVIERHYEKQGIFYQIWLEKLIDACIFFAFPLTVIVTLILFLRILKNKFGKRILFNILIGFFCTAIIIYEFLFGFGFLLFEESNYGVDRLLEDGKTIETSHHTFLETHYSDTYDYYLKQGPFLKKWQRQIYEK